MKFKRLLALETTYLQNAIPPACSIHQRPQINTIVPLDQFQRIQISAKLKQYSYYSLFATIRSSLFGFSRHPKENRLFCPWIKEQPSREVLSKSIFWDYSVKICFYLNSYAYLNDAYHIVFPRAFIDLFHHRKKHLDKSNDISTPCCFYIRSSCSIAKSGWFLDCLQGK